MRKALVFFTLLLLLPGLPAAALPGEEQTHDELGFPVTFNNSRITRADVIRSMGSPTDVGAGSIANARDQLLINKITERIAEIWDIQVLPTDVHNQLRREIEIRGGEAKFYEYLKERGDTIARYEEETRLQVMRYNVALLIAQGISPPPQQRVLPWSTRPTPEEVRAAIRADADKIKALGARARAISLTIEVDRKTKFEIMKKKHEDETVDVAAEILKIARGQAEKIMKRLRGGEPFLAVAKSLGIDTDKESAIWRPLPKEPLKDPVGRFLQTGKPGSYCEPIVQEGGVVRIAYLIERSAPADPGEITPELYNDYLGKIVRLRRLRAQALLRLQALDRSRVRPESVVRHLRGLLVDELKTSVDALRALGVR